MKQIASNTFEKVELGAGVLLNKFTTVDAIADEDIVCATRAGGTLTLPTGFRNIAVDGVKTNTVESYVTDGYTPTLAFTALTANADMVKVAIGAADIVDGKVIPRHKVNNADFRDYYWVGERSDGSAVVFFLGNCISTGGLSWRRNDRGESESAITLTANYTAADQDTVPFWMQEVAPATTETTEE